MKTVHQYPVKPDNVIVLALFDMFLRKYNV